MALLEEQDDITRPLLPKHIKKGRTFWYHGSTSIGGWDCPAVITRVDRKRRRFRVRSLDDMVEQNQWYDFSRSKSAPDSRLAMRVVEPADVMEYLKKRRPQLAEEIDRKKASLAKAEETLKRLDRFIEELPF